MSNFRATRTCAECPWRKDVPVGRFPPERFERLRSTVQQGFGQPVFACHKSTEGKDVACVGFLLVEGCQNFAVRLAIIRGDVDFSKLEATGPLFEDYEAMAAANGVSP